MDQRNVPFKLATKSGNLSLIVAAILATGSRGSGYRKDRGEETAAGRDAGGARPVGHGDGAELGGAEQGPKAFGGAGRGPARQGTAKAGGRLAYGEGEARATRRVD